MGLMDARMDDGRMMNEWLDDGWVDGWHEDVVVMNLRKDGG